jgi:hypothetical protein
VLSPTNPPSRVTYARSSVARDAARCTAQSPSEEHGPLAAGAALSGRASAMLSSGALGPDVRDGRMKVDARCPADLGS